MFVNIAHQIVMNVMDQDKTNAYHVIILLYGLMVCVLQFVHSISLII